MKIGIIGSGIAGLSTAWLLEGSGHEVVVVCPRAAQTPLSLQGLRVRGGTSTYVRALLRQLRCATVKLGAGISAVRKAGQQFTLTDEKGSEHQVDQVIFAAPAYKTLALLSDLAGTERLRRLLGRFEYFETAIAVHSDPSFMPRNRREWCFVNSVIHRAGCCEKTFFCGIKQGVHVFRSWITLGDHYPSDLHGLYRYHHPRMTPDYFRAQAQLAALPPGEGGVWLAGSYLLDVDTHETGLVSAMRVIKHLYPESRNLRRLREFDVSAKFPRASRTYDLSGAV